MPETENENAEQNVPSGETDAPVTPAADEASTEESPAGESEAGPAAEPAQDPKARRQARRRRSRGATGGSAPRPPAERQAERDRARAAKALARRRRRPRERERARTRASGQAPAATPPREHGPGRAKVRQGVVTSDGADKTIVVRIDVARRHRRYEKIIRSSSTLHAHDERNDAHVGDTVRVVESRPLSATKRWRLLEVLERAR
jgi:small subunit ribosomal protein S17